MRWRDQVPSLKLSALVILIVAVSGSTARSQAVSEGDWLTLRPQGEEFTIEMPKDPKFEESQEPYHRMTLNSRLYLSEQTHGPIFAIMSLSGIKSGGAGYTDFERLNSYVDAFKNLFPPKVKKDVVVKLTLVGEKALNGNPGREYRLVIGDLSGTAQVFATRRRFYAAVVLNTKKEDGLSDRFLSSLVLPEKINPQPAATTAVTLDKPADQNGAKKENPGERPKTEATPAEGSAAETRPDDAKPAEAAANSTTKPGQKAPISGGVLNGRALSLPQPVYPAAAAQARAAGEVTVQVLVDEGGNVISARAVSGPPLLQAAAVAAARQATFSPTTLMGEPVKVSGVLVYNFVAR